MKKSRPPKDNKTRSHDPSRRSFLKGVGMETLKGNAGHQREYFTEVYQEDYPARTVLPDHIVKNGQTIAFDLFEALIATFLIAIDLQFCHIPSLGLHWEEKHERCHARAC